MDRKWDKARDAAWRAFGTRYWRWIVGASVAARAVPFLLGVAAVASVIAGIGWVVRRARLPRVGSLQDLSGPPAWVAWATVGALLAVLAAWLVRRWSNPYRRELDYGPARFAKRFGAALVAAGAIGLAVWTWRGSA